MVSPEEETCWKKMLEQSILMIVKLLLNTRII